MKKILLVICCIILCSCATTRDLTTGEKILYKELKSHGITEDHLLGSYENPASAFSAGMWSLLPGGGNFYLGGGKSADNVQIIQGVFNVVTWPFSILWGVPLAVIRAKEINKKALVDYYIFTTEGKQELEKSGIRIIKQCKAEE